MHIIKLDKRKGDITLTSNNYKNKILELINDASIVFQ